MWSTRQVSFSRRSRTWISWLRVMFGSSFHLPCRQERAPVACRTHDSVERGFASDLAYVRAWARAAISATPCAWLSARAVAATSWFGLGTLGRHLRSHPRPSFRVALAPQGLAPLVAVG